MLLLRKIGISSSSEAPLPPLLPREAVSPNPPWLPWPLPVGLFRTALLETLALGDPSIPSLLLLFQDGSCGVGSVGLGMCPHGKILKQHGDLGCCCCCPVLWRCLPCPLWSALALLATAAQLCGQRMLTLLSLSAVWSPVIWPPFRCNAWTGRSVCSLCP